MDPSGGGLNVGVETILPARDGCRAKSPVRKRRQATGRKDVGAEGLGRADRAAGGAEALGDRRAEQAGVPCGSLGVAFKRRGLCPEGSQ